MKLDLKNKRYEETRQEIKSLFDFGDLTMSLARKRMGDIWSGYYRITGIIVYYFQPNKNYKKIWRKVSIDKEGNFNENLLQEKIYELQELQKQDLLLRKEEEIKKNLENQFVDNLPENKFSKNNQIKIRKFDDDSYDITIAVNKEEMIKIYKKLSELD